MSRKQPLLARKDSENMRGMPLVGTKPFKKWRKIDELFVDNSGFGEIGGPALTINEFHSKVKAGLAYGITEFGQFQVYVGVFARK